MPAEIVWPSDDDAKRVGVLRFGRHFTRSIDRDPYDGCGTVEDHGEGLCIIGPIAGEMSAQDRDDILAACAGAGFKRALVERNKRLWEYDLTKNPFVRTRI